jgi:hypothetical protein
MGCDIYFYAEKRYFYPLTTLKAICMKKLKLMLKNHNLKKKFKSLLPAELWNQLITFQDQKWKFVQEKEYYKHKKNTNPDYKSWYVQFHRNYILFGVLSGVRRHVPRPIAAYRGFPKDATRPVHQEYLKWYFLKVDFFNDKE